MITFSTWASLIVRGAPGRSSSLRPSSRRSTNRLRHLPTVGSDTLNWRETSLLGKPSARASTIRARIASACAVLLRHTQPCNTSGSDWLSSSTASFRPRPSPMPHSNNVTTN